jgi:hypothetical protein
MNKYNTAAAGFEVSCGCGRHRQRELGTTERSERSKIEGSYGETLNRRACGCEENGCGTGMKSLYGLSDRPMGSVYAPLQDFDKLYDHERALMRGTLFSTLDLPLEVGRGGRCNG